MHKPQVPSAGSTMGTKMVLRISAEKAQTLVVVAVLLVVLVGFLGLVIDGGNAYAQRRQMQHAADAAALAGARTIAMQGHHAVVGVANEYAQANGAAGCTVITTSTTVQVVVTRTVDTFFARVLGITNVPVAAKAKAEISPLQEASCLIMPLAVENQAGLASVQPGTRFTIWTKDKEKCDPPAGEYDLPPDQHGWLDLRPGNDSGDPGNAMVKCWTCAGCETDPPRRSIDIDPDDDGVVEGVWISNSSGVEAASLGDMVDCNKDQTVLIPLYDQVCDCKKNSLLPACEDIEGFSLPCKGGNKVYYHIVAFASVRIVSSEKPSGDCKPLDVEWQTLVTASDCTTGGGPPGNAWKAYLVE